MGRFDAGHNVWSLLPEFGLEVDSSVAPLTQKNPDPRFFLAPADPFCLDQSGPEGKPLLEVPITMVPVVPRTPAWVAGLAAMAPPIWGGRLRRLFRFTSVVGVQPAWYPLISLQLAATLHRRRGGRVLTMFFHSSELKPGASRLFPTEAAVSRFVAKIRTFLTWLVKTSPVEGVTLAELREDWREARQPAGGQAAGGVETGPDEAEPGSP
jgi:hypothetical protein